MLYVDRLFQNEIFYQINNDSGIAHNTQTFLSNSRSSQEKKYEEY